MSAKYVMKNSDNTTIIKFQDLKEKDKWCQLCLKDEFFSKENIKPEQVTKTAPEVLFRDKNMASYLSNKLGAAIYWHSPEKNLFVKDFWIDGKRLDEKDQKEMEGRIEFQSEVRDVLSS